MEGSQKGTTLSVFFNSRVIGVLACDQTDRDVRGGGGGEGPAQAQAAGEGGRKGGQLDSHWARDWEMRALP